MIFWKTLFFFLISNMKAQVYTQPFYQKAHSFNVPAIISFMDQRFFFLHFFSDPKKTEFWYFLIKSWNHTTVGSLRLEVTVIRSRGGKEKSRGMRMSRFPKRQKKGGYTSHLLTAKRNLSPDEGRGLTRWLQSAGVRRWRRWGQSGGWIGDSGFLKGYNSFHWFI